MIRISKSEMKDKLVQLMELGLTNADIATRLNEEFNADATNALTSIKVGQLKEAVGLKGWKPKKKSLFELVDDEETPSNTYPEPKDMEEYKYEEHHQEGLTEQPTTPEEVDEVDDFLGATYKGADL